MTLQKLTLNILALMQAEDMPVVFEIVNREADLTMNRVVVMIKDMGMQDQVSLFVPNEKT